jgi:hypothetical protein
VLEEGDIFNIPTGIFRGFENIGTDYGMIMAILGGDDAGGGVIWAPQVIEDAKDHGLVLGKNGKLYDSKKGQSLPEGVPPMPLLTDEELKAFPEPTTATWSRVRRPLLGPDGAVGPAARQGHRRDGILRDRPGFEVEFLSRNSIPDEFHAHDHHAVLMPMRGHWRLRFEGGYETVLNPGDTRS